MICRSAALLSFFPEAAAPRLTSFRTLGFRGKTKKQLRDGAHRRPPLKGKGRKAKARMGIK